MQKISLTVGVAAAPVALAAMVLTAVPAHGQDWPQWRGADGNGVSTETGWDAAAFNSPVVRWRANVGAGYSSVSIKGPHVYTIGNSADKDHVSCLDFKTGREIWKRSYGCPAGSHGGPRATPVVDGNRVYTLSRDGQVFCLDEADGQVHWRAELHRLAGVPPPQWGFAGSACVTDSLVILNAGRHGVALKKASGELAWASPSAKPGYATPVPYTFDGKPCLAVFGALAVHAVDRDSGQKLWSYAWKTSYDVNAADPIVLGTKMLITSGYDHGCAMLDFAAAEPKVDWENKALRGQFSSPVLYEGFIYGVDGNAGGGSIVCLDPQTGRSRWRQSLGFGALMIADGKIIFVNEKGSLHIAPADPGGYKELARATNLLPARCWTMPVFCRAHIFARNHNGDLVCIGAK